MKKKRRVFVLGAGFSVSAGIPSQQYLLEKILNIKDEDITFGTEYSNIPTDKKIFLRFISFLYGDFNTNNITLEDIYTIIDQSIITQRNIGIFNPSSLLFIRESLDRLISFVVNIEITDSDIELYETKLKKILSGNFKNEFISLNWDFLLERVLIKMGYKIEYGIPLNIIDKNNGTKISVLKPHGSLNWKLCPVCETIYAFYKYDNIPVCKQCTGMFLQNQLIMREMSGTYNIHIKEGLMPLLVSPTFLKSNFVPQLNMIMQKIYTKLVSANEIFFIGYSLPVSDHDIRQILIKANSISNKTSINVILKSNDRAEKEMLKKNYLSIYKKENISFKWNGF